MYKVKKTAILAFIMAAFTACSSAGGVQTDTVADTSAQISEQTPTVTEQKEKSDTAAASADTAEEDHVSSVMEYQFHIPAEYKHMHRGYRRLYSYEMDSGSVVYYSLINIPDYYFNHSEDNYTLDDAPDITWEFLLEDMRAIKLPAGAQKSECKVDSDEKRKFLGTEVIRRTGTIKLEKYGDIKELAYCAYYMTADMQNGDYKQVPVVWIAFSEDLSDEARAYIEESVDFTYENSELES